ncbi:midasin [[Candida] jaroonii]|uniref:Midasin n=1 Tax=[Candida] jaroonii TaxID=467808 RepID=A0ACA9YCF2_9ASCO|nr:midasin [[Candida] jaroonii]
MNQIIINLREAQRLYEFYEHMVDYSLPEIYNFKQELSIGENLNQLSLFGLSQTIPTFYAFKPIFLDLIARWIENHKGFESEFSKIFKVNHLVEGSIVLSSLSKLIGISNESVNLIEYFLSNVNILEDVEKNINSIDHKELESILLSFYRLANHDFFKFGKFINPRILYTILSSQTSNVAKYLSILVLSICLQSSEAVLQEMIDQHTTTDLHGSYEGYDLDYKFLSLSEAKRLQNFHNLSRVEGTSTVEESKSIILQPGDLSPLVTSVFGVLVPNLTKHVPLDLPEFVPTKKSIGVLRNLASNIQRNLPTMLHGPAGSGKTFLFNQLSRLMGNENSIIKIHLGEQTDAKLLLGTYSSGDKPGTFKWRSGVLTTAVKEGKWVLVEDIDKAPTEVLSILLTLLEKRQLIIPSRGEVIKAHNNFQIVSTIRMSDKDQLPDLIGLRLWSLIQVDVPNQYELVSILSAKFPLLKNLVKKFLACFEGISKIYSSNQFISLNKGSHPRTVSVRDLIKFCSRCDKILNNNSITSADELMETSVFDQFFQEAIDCFGSSLTDYNALIPLSNIIGEHLEVAPSRINLFLTKHVPQFFDDDESLKVGRAVLNKSNIDNTLNKFKKSSNITAFARTNHSLRLMEQISVSVEMTEPVLLVGETGTGKTTVVQQIAKLMNKKLTVINVSQQTESGDLLGGYKPVNTKIIAIPLQEIFENLFITTFSKRKNEKFSSILTKVFNRGQWKNVIKLWKEAVKMSKELLNKEIESDNDEFTGNGDQPKKKRRLRSHERKILLDKWVEFEHKVKEFEIQSNSLDNSFVFNFVEGSLVQAIRKGDWLLLDEINLASSDTLESIADLLDESVDQRSILLSEKGDIDPIKAHPDFRIFGCMNPSTDVGKKDLPLSIRSRFTEIYVHSPDRDINDLLSIIDKYIGKYAISDEWIGQDIAELYLEAKNLSESNRIVDGANQKPHFSIRTLTRTLLYVVDIVSIYGLRRSLYEGFCMSFLTLLDLKSESLLKPVIEKYTIGKLKNQKSVMKQLPPCPSKNTEEYVQFRHYWMKHGPEKSIPQPHYIITPFVEKNMLNLVRATAGRRFPVLIQGPTSAGKTSMIQYLANITGHKFVRINNHEHTDLQEYLGTYVSDSTGKLVFREGILVEAIRNGYWIVLDELNLAPTDILEALNRLLDDNRELFIPETQEVVHPHPDFMLFATQNPPGIYGGRKMLSRAFRNRFLELHFDDIPQDELEIILKERCKIAPSYGKRIVEVYKQLTIQRQSTRLFEQKNSFATLRDLFRWALREAVGYEELAANGYMLLAERVRKPDEKLIVKQTIEKVMKVKLDMDKYYESLEDKALLEFNTGNSIVWTKAMRRLAVLVSISIKYNEPLLLVGETGCGKTTVCQTIAEFSGKKLVTVNAHQNTETSDILGAQRPVRNRFEIRSRLYNNLSMAFGQLDIVLSLGELKLDNLIARFDQVEDYSPVDKEILEAIEADKVNCKILFEWSDGPLVHSMKEGQFFLLDEISLADDSVLERLNSVLEPERSLLLAEKGTDDAFIVGHKDFQFLATMNPGGDYGKKELSPALRNRFTEIWVPSMEDFDDVTQIVQNKLHDSVSQLCQPLVEFSEYYGKKFGAGNITSGIISLRDILAWVQFINACVEKSNIDVDTAFLHGAAMVFIDSLGTNNTAYLAENEVNLNKEKFSCVKKLGELVNKDLSLLYKSEFKVSLFGDSLNAGSFSIPRICKDPVDDFLLSAPTTSANAMRVIRAMQVHKPILLEGSPGVGKTSLISAIAKATGNTLIRINLSEQTDLVDLFGSDSPAEGGKTGEFVWRDAPFLRAMQKGEWVLLDEMNLASQSVLEGLNACLDHRGEAYIPELDKAFTCHPDFTVFAAQNPQYQGGGRKGLPKSFVNRFTVVYVDILKKEDLSLISQHLYPNVDQEIGKKMIDFMSELEKEVIVQKKWGSSGGPWEFNLRDTLRWLELFNSNSIFENLTASDFFGMIIRYRFRSPEDQKNAILLFETIFGKLNRRDNYFNITDRYVQAGAAVINKSELVKFNQGTNSIPLQCNFKFLEAAIHCVNHNLPLILTGPSNSGKTELVRFLAKTVGAKLNEFAMNSDVDSMDILGGYEQVDLTRGISVITSKLKSILQELLLLNLKISTSEPMILKQALELFGYIENNDINLNNFHEVHQFLKSFLSIYSNEELKSLNQDCAKLLEKMDEDSSVKFEWFDGLLVQAVEQGYWLILDNANLCSPSVLDRLNSLLEVNGSLIINECSSKDGQPRILKPHPNFRLFLTVDPKYGELSRAMRNRGIELYMDSLHTRSTAFDKRQLGIFEIKTETDVVDRFSDLRVEDNVHDYPLAGFFSPIFSFERCFVNLTDIQNDKYSSVKADNLSGLVQFNSLSEFSKWTAFVTASKEYSSVQAEYASQIQSRIEFLEETGVLGSLTRIFGEVTQRLGEVKEEFLSFQSLNILLNSTLMNRETTEPIYMFQVSSGILNCQTVIQRVEQKAMSGNLSDLSYIERSAAMSLGRAIKNKPRLNVYAFSLAIANYVREVFINISGNNIYKDDKVYHSLYQLLVIWNSLTESSHKQNESQLRVYRDLVSSWCQENSGIRPIHDSIASLTAAVEHFSISFDLSTGFFMETIWENFRSKYPNSLENWEKAIELMKVFDEFDCVAQKQSLGSLDQVCTFQRSLIQLYDTVLEGSVSSDEFEVIIEDLKSGIEKLKLIVQNFTVERRNDFIGEFELMSMFNQLNDSVLNRGTNEDLIKLSSLSGRPTSQFIKSRHDRLFIPYPPILDNICKFDNGHHSLIPQLFDDSFAKMISKKSSKFNQTSGKFLQMKLDDMKYFVKSLLNNSENVSSNVKSNFAHLLISWILEIVKSSQENKDYIEFMSKLSSQDILDHSENMNTLEELIEEFSGPAADCFRKFFVPSLKIIVNSCSKGNLGKAYILFACGAIQLYLPSSAFDPAIKEHVLYNKYLTQIELSKELIDTWKDINIVLNGDEDTLALRLLNEEEVPELPEKPRVFRDSPVDGLFEEWKAFMDSTISAEQVEGLMKSAEVLNEESEQLLLMFQNNSSQFVYRMDKNFSLFADLNDILKGYIFALKIGFDLISVENDESNRYETDLLSVNNPSKLASFAKVEKMFDDFKDFSKKQGIESTINEKVMIYFMKIFLAHGVDISGEMINQSLQSIYYRWTLRKLKETEYHMQKDSLYKFNDPDADIEGDFKLLFPDFEDVIDADISGVKNNQSFSEIYYNLAKSYISAMGDKEQIDMNELITEGSQLVEDLSEHGDKFKGEYNSVSNLVASIHAFGEAYGKFSQVQESTFDFYRESSPRETRRAIDILDNIISFTNKLLIEWPEHATLRDIVRVCNEFLDYPLNMPIARQLQKIEQIYTFISEWEKYAHSKISLKTYFDQLTDLIVSWRRLELSTWKELFNHEDHALEINIGSWWFHLFETIVLPLGSEEQDLNLGSLLSALHIFMTQTSFGEFKLRLSLLRAFREHVVIIEGKGETFHAISNFITYYKQFVDNIDEKIRNERKKLEKDINEVILLASWKDVNIDALKQSARKSHNSLYKIVRKYRSLLATPVSSLIEQGVPEGSSSIEVVNLKQVVGSTSDMKEVKEICCRVSTWNERPKRLQDISIIDNNMSIYVKNITEEELPSLYEFAKEILEDSEKLRKETPTVHKEETKKLIASLKNQKAKLLSSSLKEFRRIGLKTTAKAEIKAVQTSSNHVLANSVSFTDTLMEGADGYFFRMVDILPRLKSSMTQLPEDVPQPDLERGFAVAENIIHALIIGRKPLLNLSKSMEKITGSVESLELVSSLYDSNDKLSRVSVNGSINSNLKVIGNILNWLPRLMNFSIESLELSKTFTNTITSNQFSSLQSKLSSLEAEYKNSNEVSTDVTTGFITNFQNFILDFKRQLYDFKIGNENFGFFTQVILDWLEHENIDLFVDSSTSIVEIKVVEDIELSLRNLTNSIIIVMQKVVDIQKEEFIENDDDWFQVIQKRISSYIKSTHHRNIEARIASLIDMIQKIEYNSETSRIVSALTAFSIPIIKHYLQLMNSVFSNARQNYIDNSHGAYILISILYNLSTKGFCSPEAPSEEKTDDNLQDGTGLGDGEGATNNSKDVEEDEDLSEQAQTDNKEKDKDGDEDENDDAVDMEGDMAGDLEDASDQDDSDDENEDEGEDMDEQIEDIDDLDPNEIDEKMWDEEAKENDKEKDSDQMPNSNNQDDMVANEDDENKKDNNTEDNKNDTNEENDNDENDENDGEDEKDVGEQEDDIKHEDENNKMDDHVPDAEALDLPEDMNLDDEEDDQKNDDDDGDDNQFDLEEEKKPNEEQEDEGPENENEANHEDIEMKDGDEEDESADIENEGGDMDEDDDGEEQEEGGQDNEAGEDAIESEDEAVDNKDQEEKESGGDQDEKETAEGVEGAQTEEAQDDVDIESAVKQESGEKGEGADNQVIEEQDDLGATGASSTTQAQDQENQDEAPKNDESNEMARESIKELGDSLKEFHRRHQEIQQASNETEEEVDQKANERPDEFEHVNGANTNSETQALGSADKEQMQSIDEDKAIDDEMEDIQEKGDPEIKQEAEVVKDAMDVDENVQESNENDPEADFEGKTKGGFINDRSKVKEEESGAMFNEFEDFDMIEEFNADIADVNITSNDEVGMSLDVARDLWRQSELATQELASGLSEQLRLILEPTLATKLKGDYKTGKRLNMKRIIPYIASEFRKDKIWLRRTKPSKRQYQIMIAVDDSKSMSESKSTELAFNSIALVTKALTQLESGGLSIVRFGEDVKVVHGFDKPFNNQETGAKIFQYFDFQQTKTDIKNLVNKSLKIFENAKISSNNDLWQLQIILSDGVCEDHSTIQALVRKARESRIMLVFVVIDGINSNESIMDMSQVKYEFDDNGNSVLKVDKYLDSFPFEFYVVVNNINELPEMLSIILRQYFTEIASVNA